jgi:hypothetical protein
MINRAEPSLGDGAALLIMNERGPEQAACHPQYGPLAGRPADQSNSESWDAIGRGGSFGNRSRW